MKVWVEDRERYDFFTALGVLYVYYGSWAKVAFRLGVPATTVWKWYHLRLLPRSKRLVKEVIELAKGVNVDEVLEKLERELK